MVAPHLREQCPDYFEPVRHLLMANQPEWSPRGMEVETDRLLVDTVSRFHGALGVVSWVFAKDLVGAGQLKVLRIDGISPVAAEIETGRYSMTGT
jgi:phosphate transport system substrate-binding protein